MFILILYFITKQWLQVLLITDWVREWTHELLTANTQAQSMRRVCLLTIKGDVIVWCHFLTLLFWNMQNYNAVRFTLATVKSDMVRKSSSAVKSCLCFVVRRTALMLAALGRHTDCVHILLEKGAKADAADKKGFTALHRAVSVFAVLVFMSCHFFLNALLYVNAGVLCCYPLISYLVSSTCRPCWAVRTVYLLCWNTGPLLCVETLREGPRCTSQRPSATRSYSAVC